VTGVGRGVARSKLGQSFHDPVHQAVLLRLLGVHPEVALGVACDALVVLAGRAREGPVEAFPDPDDLLARRRVREVSPG
jgi:hypothetical protein